jgi:hypothetical protein
MTHVKSKEIQSYDTYLKLTKNADFKMQEWKEYEPHEPAYKNEVTTWERQKYLYA